MEEETLQSNSRFPLSIRFIMSILSSFIAVIAIYYISLWIDFIDPTLSLPGFNFQPFALIPVLSISLIGISMAALVFMILKAYVKKNWKRFYLALAAVVLLTAFIVTLLIPEASVGMIISLNLMHIAIAVCTIYFLVYFNQYRP
ncbi:MAG: DUF6069 family protein [Bacteroidales bacterium]|nr:DUF6069 family protein [Bacteroidales bacterium]MCF8343701.1 DUF6069 family protein [Bacteroidales bacterium]MCF8352342.1 DUF6069 family protein [Bacteroidales bacterium]MCF8377370.1 DUF6069 family protein [Bacteroidales bacterium]MCF8401369.1 DUF6069 family protein [Bacteroidales bacterium]